MRPADACELLGTRYEVSCLPLYCGRDAIEELLSSWTGAVPVATFRDRRTRTWIVSAPSPPLQSKIQHEEGLAFIQVATPKTGKAKTDQIRFVPSEKPKEEPAWLRSWAGRPRSKPMEEDAGMPAAAESKPTPRASQPSSASLPLAPVAAPPPPLQDIAAMLKETIAPLSSSIAALESHFVKLSSEVAQLQSAASQRGSSPQLSGGERADARASRSRGRVPVGKKLFG